MSSRTALYDRHVALGGRMVDFAGWEMPVQYTGILDEHRAVREAAGMFDISHMGEFFVSGAASTAWLDGLLTNHVAKLAVGEAQYTLLLNERGGVIDDLIVYRLGDGEYLLVVNAAKIAEDAAWLRAHAVEGVTFIDRSGEFSAIAVQGPVARGIFQTVFEEALSAEHNRVAEIRFGNEEGFAVTTGYTGEDGFEAVIPNAAAGALWDALAAAGAKPCGLGARDTLRLEMGYPLNGSDLAPDRTPLEAGLGFFVDFTKGEFIGRSALAAQKEAGLPARLAALAVTEKSPPMRSHYPVWANGGLVSETCSGALSPTLGHGIAMAYLPAALAKPGQAVEIEVRGRRYKASVVKKPFLKRD
ncbi:MAG: glycine cleavage system aminomethyltransferase GcvT [Terrimicrobiaceae bacterium]|nr:glycine cleavage system aminomethyltransferase GcvT [Terrimicrobiaceae bacterium]